MIVSEFDLGWLVGWLEGEGTFFCSTSTATATRKSYKRITVCGASVDRETLERAQGIAGGTVTGPYKYDQIRQGYYQWGVRPKAEVVDLMRQLHPLMSGRRQKQIEAALEMAGRSL